MTALNYVRLLEVWLPPSLSGPSVRPRPFTCRPFTGSAPLHLQGCNERRDPDGSRLSLRAVAAQSAPEPQLRNNGRGRVNANAQFFHQPLTVSTAWVPRSVSAEWALTRPEDRRAAWKREATFSQFTRFHQALT